MRNDIQESDNVDNRTLHLNQDLADLSLPLHEMCACFRALFEHLCPFRNFFKAAVLLHNRMP
jgi:hypothetical protein